MQKQISQILQQQFTKILVAFLLLFLLSLLLIPFFNRSQAHNDQQNALPKAESVKAQSAAVSAPYTLVGTYYSLKDNQNSILMFNNKAPQPLVVNPIFFSMSGERFDLPALMIGAISYQEFDLRDLLANAPAEFQEGSVQVTHQGMKQQLGVQVKILRLERGLIFDEQFVEPTKRFVSSRLESAWWLPSSQLETKLIVSNTTDLPVMATVKVDGTAPRQQQPTPIQLNPHQTRALDILQDLVGQQQGGIIHKEGGISITHSGTPGAILARMLVSRESTGFSTVVNFIDPQATASSKWNGSGYRIGKIGNEELTPILVARNIGNESAIVSGRLSYTNSSGEVAFINVPAIQIAANETKSINVERAVRQSNVPANVNVTDTGFEFEYSTPKGSVVMTALSVSRSGNQVFQVPLFDPNRIGTSAGGYPWKASGDYVTKLYIKNETDQLQKYVASLFYEGGDYTLGVKDIKPHQLVAIDFRALRDNQMPDVNGKIIPLNIERGQMAWSSKDKTPRTLSGRSHQSSITQGVSSTYDCRNHCYNTYYDSWLTYDYPLVYVSDIGNFVAHQQDINSYGQTLPSYPVDYPNWQSTNSTVASIYYTGEATALAVGTTFIQGSWSAERRFGEVGNEECAYESITALVEEFVEPQQCAYPTNFRQVGNGTDIGRGVLRFNYSWGSSTGNLADLSQCTVGEIVTYPGTGNYFPPSPPFPTTGFPNPTVIDLPASDGGFQDTHSTRGTFVTPYSSSSFTATQYYRYRCPCRSSGNYVNLVGPINIVRAVSPSTGGRWKFTITKSGASATIDPLP